MEKFSVIIIASVTEEKLLKIQKFAEEQKITYNSYKPDHSRGDHSAKALNTILSKDIIEDLSKVGRISISTIENIKRRLNVNTLGEFLSVVKKEPAEYPKISNALYQVLSHISSKNFDEDEMISKKVFDPPIKENDSKVYSRYITFEKSLLTWKKSILKKDYILLIILLCTVFNLFFTILFSII